MTRLIKKIFLFGFLSGLLILLIACGNENQINVPGFVLVNEEFLPLIEKKELIRTYIEGNLTNEINDNREEQNDHFLDEKPNLDDYPLTPSKSDEEGMDIRGDNSLDLAPEMGRFLKEMEQEVIELVNDLRQELGLSLLEPSKELRVTARMKSKDMFDYQYFDHQGHVTFSQLLEESQVVVKITGENIYRSQSPLTTAKLIFDTWKNSSTHYENMINEQFHYIGVGIYNVENEGINMYYATQHLTD